MMEKFANLVNEIDIQAQEARRVPNKMNSKRPASGHFDIKMSKVND